MSRLVFARRPSRGEGQGIATIPEIIWELSLGIYPLVWGFKSSPILSEEGVPLCILPWKPVELNRSAIPGGRVPRSFSCDTRAAFEAFVPPQRAHVAGTVHVTTIEPGATGMGFG